MKNLFWIVCGVLSLGLLIAWFLIVPMAEAQASKKDLDTKAKDLKDLEKRAQRKSPVGVFDVESPESIAELKKFLTTGQWAGKLRPHVDAYRMQLNSIKEHLASRGTYLRRPILETSNRSDWYKAYVHDSEKLISDLRQSGLLAPADLTETRGSYQESLEGSEVRKVLSLVTVTTLPSPQEYPLITARFRVMQLIAQRLVGVKMVAAVNPIVGPTGIEVDGSANLRIDQVRFLDAANPDQITKPITTAVTEQLTTRSMSVDLRFHGPLSTTVAALNALECNHERDKPLIAITAVNLRRRPVTGTKDYQYATTDLVDLDLALEVIEFADPAVQPAIGATP